MGAEVQQLRAPRGARHRGRRETSPPQPVRGRSAVGAHPAPRCSVQPGSVRGRPPAAPRAHADRDADPHSPVDGLLHAHMGWFVMARHLRSPPARPIHVGGAQGEPGDAVLRADQQARSLVERGCRSPRHPRLRTQPRRRRGLREWAGTRRDRSDEEHRLGTDDPTDLRIVESGLDTAVTSGATRSPTPSANTAKTAGANTSALAVAPSSSRRLCGATPRWRCCSS